MSIMDKCYSYRAADEVRAMGIYPYFRAISSEQDRWVMLKGKKTLMLGSNSYLGLTNNSEVKRAAIEATEHYGTGCAGSRFLNGTLKIHEELEAELADFVGKEAALLYSTGFQVNLGVISTIVGRKDFVVTDRTDHASIVDGARLSFGKVVKYKHNDMGDLENQLAKLPYDAGKLIVIDGIFSMDGDIAPLPDIVTLAERYNAQIMVDDAHALGVIGPNGEGTAAHFGLTDKVDIIMATFSKSLAALGGFVAAERSVIEYLKHNSRALIFSASPTPASVAAARKSLEILKREPERREQLWRNTHYMAEELTKLGFDIGKTETPIIPILVGEMVPTFTMCHRLEEEGVFVNPVVPPAVEQGRCLIRVSFMATHTIEDLDFALDKFAIVGREMGVIP